MSLAIHLLIPELRKFHKSLEQWEFQEVLTFKLPIRKLKHQVTETIKELEEAVKNF